MKFSVREMILISIFTGLTAIGAGISIPLGEVPITMQTLFVLLSGFVLGPKLAPISQIIYILLGLIGIPIFANFTGGLQTISKASFGFLIGFIFAAYAVGKISRRGSLISKKRIFVSALAGTLVIYLFGIPYMYFILNIVLSSGLSFSTIIKTGLILFLPGDLLKLATVYLVAIKILPALNSEIMASLK